MEREQTTASARDPATPFHGDVAFALPADASAPGRARSTLGRLLADDERLAVAQLAASELVTNAIRHGEAEDGGTVELCVSAPEDRLCVAVRSAGPPFEPGPRDPSEAGGWGLGIVAALARDWGVRAEPGTTVVWFVL